MRRLNIVSSLLGFILVLHSCNFVSAAVTTDKSSYQFGEPIEARWTGAADNDFSIGIFLPNQCWDTSNECINDYSTYPYLQSEPVTSSDGSQVFSRSGHVRFIGTLEIRLWNTLDNTIFANTTVTVRGSVTIQVPENIYFYIPTQINFHVSSAYHSSDDWIAVFPAELCADPNECYRQYAYVPAGVTNTSWNTTFEYDANRLNLTASYVFAYVVTRDLQTLWPDLYSASDMFFHVSTPFQFKLNGSISTPQSTYEPYQQLLFNWTADSRHSENDCIAVYRAGVDRSAEFSLHYAYVPVGASSGSVDFSFGIAEPGAYTAFYLVQCDANLNSSSVSFTVQSTATISSNAVCLENTQFSVTFTTSGFQRDSDVINIYTESCITAEDILSSTEGSACQLIATGGYIPLSVTQGKVTFTCPSVDSYTPLLSSGRFRVWYLSGWFYPVAQLSSFVRTVSKIGTCAPGCSNVNATCYSDSTCSSCTGVVAPACVPIPEPTLVGPTPQNGWNVEVFPGGSTGVINILIQANHNGYGPLVLQQSGFWQQQIDSGAVTIVETSTAFGSIWNVTWATSSLEQNVYVDFCFTAVNSLGVTSESRCYTLQTKGRNCRSYGDPHMTTFDGNFYDFQGFGDFYLMKSRDFSSDKFSIQIRYAPCAARSGVSCNTGVAFTDSLSSFAIYLKISSPPSYQYNRTQVIEMEPDTPVRLPNGAILTFSSDYATLTIVLRSGVYVEVMYASSLTNNIQVKMPSSDWMNRVLGLCGAWDNNAAQDFVFPNGTVLDYDQSTDTDLYIWGTTWRVSEQDSGFDYVNTSWSSINVPNPYGASYAPTNPVLAAQAQVLCGQILSLTDSDYDNCLFDIQATGTIDAASAVAASFVQGCFQTADPSLCLINEGCPSRCNFKGSCADSVCVCMDGFTGTDCSQRTSGQVPVAPPRASPQAATAPQSSVAPLASTPTPQASSAPQAANTPIPTAPVASGTVTAPTRVSSSSRISAYAAAFALAISLIFFI